MIVKLALFFTLLAAVCASPSYLGFPYFGGRIVGGNQTVPGEFPHQVSVQQVRGAVKRHYCGGTIINEYWILTAGHCIPYYGAIYVKAGKYSLKTIEKNEQVSVVRRAFIHPKYVGGVAPYDIGLLRLQDPLNFNEYVQPIDLPQEGSQADGVVVLSGWGSITEDGDLLPDTLQKAELPIVDLDTCRGAIEDLVGPSPLAETNICTGPLTGGISSCSGDSGGPLIKVTEPQPEVIGIVSWGVLPCGSEGAPSVYTRVSAYIDWIEKTMTEN